MRINTTVPDDLGAKAKELDINISAVLREALERKINMITSTMELEELQLEDRTVAFKGTHVANSRDGRERWSYFVTAKGQVVTYDSDELMMWVHSSDEFESSDVDPYVLSAVLDALGRDYVEILDI